MALKAVSEASRRRQPRGRRNEAKPALICELELEFRDLAGHPFFGRDSRALFTNSLWRRTMKPELIIVAEELEVMT